MGTAARPRGTYTELFIIDIRQCLLSHFTLKFDEFLNLLMRFEDSLKILMAER